VLRELLARHQGNVAAVARVLGRDRVQVHRWMRRYNLKADTFRG
jgi:transcriptional regulator with GAF, ATPase, and Fis domain